MDRQRTPRLSLDLLRDFRAAARHLSFTRAECELFVTARKATGVAVGKWPHLIDHLRSGELVAPLGASGAVTVGAFYLEVADDTQRKASDVFLDWLRGEAGRDVDPFCATVVARRGQSRSRKS